MGLYRIILTAVLCMNLSAYACEPDDVAKLAPVSRLTREEILVITDRIVDLAPPGIADKLLDVFDRHHEFLANPENIAALERRAKTLGKRMFDGWLEKTVPGEDAALDSASHPVLDDVAFLIALRGNIKDLVWDSSSAVRGKLSEKGVDPQRYSNLVPQEAVTNALAQIRESKLIADNWLDAKLEAATGRRLQDYLDHPELVGVYADQIAAVISPELRIKSKAFKDGKKTQALALAENLEKPFMQGALKFSLNGRDVNGLKGGSKAGDCTADCSSINFWTQGPWNAAFENNELQVMRDGKFFSRFLFIAGESDGKPTLFVHAVEFNPQVQENRSPADAKTLRESFDFISQHAKNAGFHDLLVTNISNSSSYGSALIGLLGKAEDALQERPFALLDPLTSVSNLHGSVTPANADTPVKIYLQGWGGPTVFDRSISVGKAVKAQPVRISEREIARNDVERAAHIFHEMLNSDYQRFYDMRMDLEFFRESPFLKKTPAEFETWFRQELVQARAVGQLLLKGSKLARYSKNLDRIEAAAVKHQTRLYEAERQGDWHEAAASPFLKLLRETVELLPDEQGVSELRDRNKVFDDDVTVGLRFNPRDVRTNWVADATAKLTEAGLPADSVAWLVAHPQGVLDFYFATTGDNATATSLGTQVPSYRIPLR